MWYMRGVSNASSIDRGRYVHLKKNKISINTPYSIAIEIGLRTITRETSVSSRRLFLINHSRRPRRRRALITFLLGRRHRQSRIFAMMSFPHEWCIGIRPTKQTARQQPTAGHCSNTRSPKQKTGQIYSDMISISVIEPQAYQLFIQIILLATKVHRKGLEGDRRDI